MRWWSCLALFLGTHPSLARGEVYASCLVANVTWDPSLIIDTIPSVQTPEDCQENCSEECSAFTWTSPEASLFHNLCVLFGSTNETIPCTDCVSGPNECLCSMIGECSIVGDNVLDSYLNVPDATSCHQFCGNNSECNYFTFFSEGHPLQHMCLIFRSCEVMDETCEGCISGPTVCETCDFDETIDGECIIDEGYNYLFLGPGAGTSGQSELLHLPSLE